MRAGDSWAGRSTQGVQGEEEGEGERKAAEDQNIFLTRGQSVHPQAEIEILFKSTRFHAWADVPERRHPTAADRATKPHRVEVFEGCAGGDADFFHAFVRVVDVPAAAAFEAMRSRVGLRFLCNRSIGDDVSLGCGLLGGLKLVAHRCDARPADSIGVGSPR